MKFFICWKQIEEVKVEGYDEDILQWQIPEQPLDVNAVPSPSGEEMKVKITKAKEKVKQPESYENDPMTTATDHLDAIKKFILEKKNIVKQKLCVNMMPKITWKIMKMNSKLQLQSLLYQAVKYEESFNPRLELPNEKVGIFSLGFSFCSSLGRTNSDLNEKRKDALKVTFNVKDLEEN